MWQIISAFVVSHRKLISIGSIVSSAAIFARGWTWFKQRRVKSLARKVRTYSDKIRKGNLRISVFPRQHLAEQLGSSGKHIGEVLEFMEEKGWAIKVRFPPDSWQIN